MATFAPARHALIRVLALAVAYVIVARLGLMFDAVSGFATLVWPPTGIALAALLLYGRRLWPGVALGAFAVNVWVGAPVLVALGIAVGNTLEAVIGEYGLRRLGGFQRSFDRLGHVLGLILPAAVVSTLVSATIGVLSLHLGGVVPADQVAQTWRAWWVGDALGDLIVFPVLLTWATVRGIKTTPRRALEVGALTVALVGVSAYVFLRPHAVPKNPFELPHVLFPVFAWASLRFGVRGAATATAFSSAIAVWATTCGLGPFAGETLAGRLLVLQTFMGSVALTSLIVAVAISERTRAIRAREEFVATVSHDLKSPLNAVAMSATLLLKKLSSDDLKQQAEKHGQLVQRSVDRMSRLIRDLLDAAAADAGRMPVEPRREAVRTLISEAVDLLRPLVTPKNQELRAECSEELDVMCDRDRVLQVLSNLIGNAVKFTPEGGRITVRANRSGRNVLMSVADEGVGIEPERLRHIFERFGHARSADHEGTGLGLSIAKGIVEAHGGTMWAESRVGVGSTFCFMLPACPDEGRPVPKYGSCISSAEGPRLRGPAGSTNGTSVRRG